MAFKLKYQCEYCGNVKSLTNEEVETAKCECEESAVDVLYRKYTSGNYVLVDRNPINYEILDNPVFSRLTGNEIAVHIKHFKIIYLYIYHNAQVGYYYTPEFGYSGKPFFEACKDDWIREYDESTDYKVNPTKDNPVYIENPSKGYKLKYTSMTEYTLDTDELTDINSLLESDWVPSNAKVK